jgi:hypothetical protein
MDAINLAESGCSLKQVGAVPRKGWNSRIACIALACTGERWQLLTEYPEPLIDLLEISPAIPPSTGAFPAFN